VLQVESLNAAYGGNYALRDVSIEVREGAFVAVVGPNGAGKTTLLKSISGTVVPLSGRITYNGQDLRALRPHQCALAGIAHVPEGRRVFKTLSVLENLEMGAFGKKERDQGATLDRIFGLFPRLAERRQQLAGTLSGGEQQMLAIGRGLASSPKLLILDEPSMGLAPAIADMIFERVQQIHAEERIAILLVEQRVAEALQTSDWAYVLESGRVILDGSPKTLMADPRVKQAYLGM
jgi:branched-chain amino acid transport system ATP-binding protein